MKQNPLQNPLLVAILALSAAGALFFQFRPPASKSPRASGKSGSASGKTAAKAASPSGVTPTASEPERQPAQSVDLPYVQQRLGKWVEAANRDPFGMYPKPEPTKEPTGTHTNVAQVLRVSAIWRQTGRRLAIINDALATEGSVILGYRIDRIDARVIRVSGALGPEQISLAEFDQTSRAPLATNVITATLPARKPSGG